MLWITKIKHDIVLVLNYIIGCQISFPLILYTNINVLWFCDLNQD
jgi:hypothetical protein